MMYTQQSKSAVIIALFILAATLFVVFLLLRPQVTTAYQLALKSWEFISQRVFLEKSLGQRNAWMNRFVCEKDSCRVDGYLQVEGQFFSSYAPPPLFLENLELLSSRIGDKKYEALRLKILAYLARLCQLRVEVCSNHFASFFEFAENTGDEAARANLIALAPHLFGSNVESVFDWLGRIQKLALLAASTPLDSNQGLLKKTLAEGEKKFKTNLGELVYAEKSDGEEFPVWRDSCYLYLAPLSSQHLRDDKLPLAGEFVRKAKIASHLKEWNNPELGEEAYFHPLLVCAKLLRELYGLTGYQELLGDFRKIMQYLISNNVVDGENPEFKGTLKRVGQDGSYSLFTPDTLLFINLLLQDPGYEYKTF